MSDVLKRPVHIALLKPSHIQKLAEEGKFVKTPYGLDPNTKPPVLPAAVADHKTSLNIPKATKHAVASSNVVKLTQKQLKLRIIHDRVPAPTPAPPCSSCKTSACCYAFVVNITEEEYDSGLYGDAAVKLTPEIYKQLHSQYLQVAVLGAPVASDANSYYLDGKIGEPCPFLQADNRCGIYDIRPITCRSYSCLTDSRITDAMRQGTDGLDLLSMSKRRLNVIKS